MPPEKLYRALQLRREKGWLAILTPRALRVDLAILDHYNWQNRMAFPSYDTLMRETGLSRAAVREALRELAFYDLWAISRVTRREGGKTRRFNVYKLLPSLVPDPPVERYVPSTHFSHTTRPSTFGEKEVDSSVPYITEIGESKEPQSRLLNLVQSRVLHERQSGGLDWNYAVNNAKEPRNRASSLHSQEGQTPPDGEGPRKLRFSAPVASKGDFPRSPRAAPPLSAFEAEHAARKAWRLIHEGADRGAVAEQLAKHLNCPLPKAELLLARVRIDGPRKVTSPTQGAS